MGGVGGAASKPPLKGRLSLKNPIIKRLYQGVLELVLY
jgi:hypothetical protein